MLTAKQKTRERSENLSGSVPKLSIVRLSVQQTMATQQVGGQARIDEVLARELEAARSSKFSRAIWNLSHYLRYRRNRKQSVR